MNLPAYPAAFAPMVITAVVFSLMSSASSAAVSSLLAGDAVLTIDTTAFGGLGGISSLTNAGIEQVEAITYFYRVGDTGPEKSVFSLPVTETPQTGVDDTKLVFENEELRLELQLVIGDSPTQTVLYEGFSVQNKMSSPLHLFRYADFDLGGTADIEVSASQQFPGPAYSGPISLVHVDQKDGRNALRTVAALSGLAGLTTRAAVSTSDSQSLSTFLTDMDSLTLTDPDSTSKGPADLSSLLQWSVSGSTSRFSGYATSTLDLPVIPEPTSFLVFGGLGSYVCFGRPRLRCLRC